MKKQEEKQEEVVVENEPEVEVAPSEEVGPEPIVYNDPALEEIEKERLKFFQVFRVQNTLKWIISLICIAAIVVAFIVFPNVISDNDGLQKGLMIGVAVAALGGTLGYSVFTRRSMNAKMKKYFNLYYKKINEFAFGQEGFDKVVLQEPGKITIDLFKDTNLYKDIVDVGSRGLTEFEYHGIPMRIVDCAGNIRDEKRIRPVFVGKLLHCACKYLGDESIVIYFKGNDRALPPTNVSELKVIEDNSKYIIYSNSAEAKKIIKADIKKMFDKIEMNNLLVDLAISMHDGKIFVCFGYDDPLMVLPLQNQFDPRPNEQYKKDLGQIIKVVEALSK